MIKNFSVSIYVIPFIFAISSLFFEQFDYLHTTLLFCLAICVDADFGKKLILYSKSWPSSNDNG